MKRLGPEIISLIIDKLGTKDNQNFPCRDLASRHTFGVSYFRRLSPYATISRAWQHEVERRCFRSLVLYSAEDIAIFSRLLSTSPGRCVYLRQINLSSLPKTMPPGRYSQHPLTFRNDVDALLAVLHRCDEEDERAGIPTDPTLCLELKPSWDTRVPAPSDLEVRGLDQVDFSSYSLPAFPE